MKRKTTFFIVTLLVMALAFSATLVAAQEEEPAEQETKTSTIYEIIQAEPELQSLELLVEAAGLADNLDQSGPFTVFAPTNAAMASIQSINNQTEEDLTEILLYHVANGRYPVPAVRESVVTLNGDRLLLDAGNDSPAMVNRQVEIVTADIEASNGVVHIIDAVLPVPEVNSLYASDLGSASEAIPAVLAQDEDDRFGTFLELAAQAGLLDVLSNTHEKYTLFVPTDAAFAAVPEEMMANWQEDPDALWAILAYHIVEDELSINQVANDHYIPTLEGRALVVTTGADNEVYLNGRALSDFNILAANGTIHVVDEVVLP